MSLDFSLRKAEKINAYITLAAVILSIASLNLSEKLELEGNRSKNKSALSTRRQHGSTKDSSRSLDYSAKKKPVVTPTPSQLSAAAGWLLVIAGIIGTEVASARLREVSEQTEHGEPTSPLEAVSLLTLGTYLGFASSILSALGAQQKVDQEDTTVVITPI